MEDIYALNTNQHFIKSYKTGGAGQGTLATLHKHMDGQEKLHPNTIRAAFKTHQTQNLIARHGCPNEPCTTARPAISATESLVRPSAPWLLAVLGSGGKSNKTMPSPGGFSAFMNNLSN
jgi:hypothetical protein